MAKRVSSAVETEATTIIAAARHSVLGSLFMWVSPRVRSSKALRKLGIVENARVDGDHSALVLIDRRCTGRR
jgi:hypothetical protein